MRKLVLLVATGAGSGFSPIAPGTLGSLIGLLVWFPLAGLSPAGYVLAFLGTVALGVWAAERAEQIFGQRDDRRITIDEVAGMLLSLAFLPVRFDVALVGFLSFRLFDIWKPPPARAAERLPGGVGVITDDLVAGVYANLVGQLVFRIVFPGGFA